MRQAFKPSTVHNVNKMRKLGNKNNGDKNNLTSLDCRVKKNVGCLLIKAFRQWFDGRRNWHLVGSDFRQFFGCDLGNKIFSRLDESLGDLEIYATRPLLIQRPGKNAFGLDEILIYQAIALLQQSQFNLADTLIENIVCQRGHGAIADGFFMLARYFTKSGYILPVIRLPEKEEKQIFLQAAE